MPNIRTYDSPIGTERAPFAPSDRAVGAAEETGNVEMRFGREATEQLKQGFGELGRNVQQTADQIDQVEAQREIRVGATMTAQTYQQLLAGWNQTAKNADVNDPNVANDYMQNTVEPALDKLQETFQTTKGQEWAQEQSAQIRRSIYEHSNADMVTMGGMAAQQNLKTTVDALSNTVRSDPTTLDHTFDLLNHSIDGIVSSNPNLSPSQVEQLRTQLTTEARKTLAQSAYLGSVDKNPQAALADLNNGKYDQFINGAMDRNFWQGEAQRAIDQKNAQLRGQVSMSVENSLSEIEHTGNASGAPSTAQIMQAFPGAEGTRMVQRLAIAHTGYALSQRIASTTPAEDQRLLQGSMPAPGDPMYAVKAQLHDQLAKVVADKHDALAKDPAGYVVNTNPKIQQQWKDAGSDPQKISAAMGATEEGQRQVGVADSDLESVPPVVAQNYNKQLLTMGPSAAADTLSDLHTQMGDGAFHKFMGGLENAGLPRGYGILENLNSSGNHVAANNLGAALADPKDTKAAAGEANVRQGATVLDQNPDVAHYLKSYSTQANGGQVVAETKQAISALSWRYMSQGMSPEDATRKAVTDVLGRYDYGNDGERIPQGLGDAVGTAEQQTMNRLQPTDLAIPRDSSGAKLDNDQLRGKYLDVVRGGRWVTNPKGDGVVRVTNDGAPILLKNGKPLQILFSQMQKPTMPISPFAGAVTP
jgi:hypothetical protein